MSKPANQQLYDKVKAEIVKENPTHSAYRSAAIVALYKKRGGTYVGKKDKNQGLSRWFREDWRTDDGKETYTKGKRQVFRPTKRITEDTPTTFGELTKKQIERAKKEKAKTGRVKKFDV